MHTNTKAAIAVLATLAIVLLSCMDMEPGLYRRGFTDGALTSALLVSVFMFVLTFVDRWNHE